MSDGRLISVGDIFGEAALQSQSTYDCDIIAQGPVSLLVISRDSVEQLCGPIRDIVARSSAASSGGADPQKQISEMTSQLSISGENYFAFVF